MIFSVALLDPSMNSSVASFDPSVDPSAAPSDPFVDPMAPVTTRYDLPATVTIIANPLSSSVSSAPPRVSAKTLGKQKTSVPSGVFSESAASPGPSRLRGFVSPSGDPRDYLTYAMTVQSILSST